MTSERWRSSLPLLMGLLFAWPILSVAHSQRSPALTTTLQAKRVVFKGAPLRSAYTSRRSMGQDHAPATPHQLSSGRRSDQRSSLNAHQGPRIASLVKNLASSLVRNLASGSDFLWSLIPSTPPVPRLLRSLATRHGRVPPERLTVVRRGDFALNERRTGEEPLVQQLILRVVTWNINRGGQYEKILRALKQALPADIYLLQEVDCQVRRTHYRNVAKDLARQLKMNYAFGIEFQELGEGKPGHPALHGQATLSHFPIKRARVLRFRHQPKKWSHDWFQPRRGGRMALVTEIETPAGSLLVYNTHLESRTSGLGRARQLHEIFVDIGRQDYSGPVLIGGDLNTKEQPRSPVLNLARLYRAKILPSPTSIPLAHGQKWLDWILTLGVTPISARIHTQITGSDHKPLSVELQLGIKLDRSMTHTLRLPPHPVSFATLGNTTPRMISDSREKPNHGQSQ